MTHIRTILVFTFVAPVTAKHLTPGDHERMLRMGQRTRRYYVHVPPQYDSRKSIPVVLVFHGGATNAKAAMRYTGLSAKSDREGFVVVYPDGTGRVGKILTWNGGNCCGYAMRNNIDDVAFVDALLNDLATVVQVDKRRVFATGISNGAILSYLLASKLSGRIAAIAPIAGPMGTESCSPSRPVPVIHFHGTEDQNAPYDGGRGKGLTSTNFFSVKHSIDNWVKANGCDTTPMVQELEDKYDDKTKVIRKTWMNGNAGSEVVLLQIEGGGHTWPGMLPRMKLLGISTKEISANDLMWEFFKKHPMPK